MTPEHKFVLFITALSSLPTTFFTGVVAFWTWRRDQERVVVQKSPMHLKTLDGSQSKDTLCGSGIVVTNLSLFTVRIVGLGFRLDGKNLWVFDRDDHEEEWPSELPSHARMLIQSTAAEWEDMKRLGVPDRIEDWSFIAVARTEAGERFASDRLSVNTMRRLRWLRRKLPSRKRRT